jgi:hypothetical protein
VAIAEPNAANHVADGENILSRYGRYLKIISGNRKMARGGFRNGSGRKVGSASKRTREIANAAAENGETPLEYMLRVMRDDTAKAERRDEMAKAAAPFIHPRLSAIGHSGEIGTSVQVIRVPAICESDAEWERRYVPKSI